MARIRTIKPEFPQSESVGRLSREARLLFIQLWTIADDAGRTRAASRMLASLLYPYDDDAPALIDGWLAELSDAGMVALYEHDGARYLEITKWLEHQKIDKPSKSRLPEIREGSRMFSKPREPSTTDLVPSTVDLVPNVATQRADAAPLDLKAQVFGPCLAWLARATTRTPNSLRPHVGRWCKDYGEALVIECIAAAQRESPVDPVGWLTKSLKARKNGTGSRSTINRADSSSPDAAAERRAGLAAGMLQAFPGIGGAGDGGTGGSPAGSDGGELLVSTGGGTDGVGRAA